MSGYQAKYDVWSSASRATVDMQNQISAKHNLTETQAREVGNMIHTLTFNRAYRIEEMPRLFDRLFGVTE